MWDVLRNRAYRRLFTAQVIALLGTGLATVALGLLAYDLAAGDASAVLGTALAIKMVAYVVIAPVVTALADRVPRRALLVAMDLARAGVVSALPLVEQVWQVYVLVFVLQAASATFTPAFQATVPQILPHRDDYTRALSLSRLAYDLESLVSPVLAAGLLALVPYGRLFTGTGIGFVASALLVASVVIPRPEVVERPGGVFARTTYGLRLYLATPRLRALLAWHMAVAAAGAVVVVDTVGLVRDHLRGDDTDVAVTLGAYGAGSMVVALLLPRIPENRTDRRLLPGAAFGLAATLLVLTVGLAFGAWSRPTLAALWTLLGAFTAVVLTSAGRLVRRSAAPADLPAAFAAQFSLSHACWLITYPVVGWLAATSSTIAAATATGIAAAAAITAAVLQPAEDPPALAHTHVDLSADDPHLADAHPTAHGHRHTHDYVIDHRHRRWPKPAANRS
ncbi:putative MFS family arabinose efflux permease [Stackebrandtia albiflava]|uniref:Putative MFS family arabinose efflux permease n=1 Tax=Stackebrandtia albiflava TaxID=406432 RepID=A0A562VB65_9ACTN|nr:MFS transporter [Stackebrandtia albiflava]TWJ15047.1 putative MFS family arabinose efflux permease [Stackebrandtia albiflava]